LRADFASPSKDKAHLVKYRGVETIGKGAGGGFSYTILYLIVLWVAREQAGDNKYSSYKQQMGTRGHGRRTGLYFRFSITYRPAI
jgi:hypothetical protein